MRDVALSLGSNEGNSRDTLRAAVGEIAKLHKGPEPVLCSSLYETEPWGRREQPPFLNMAVVLRTQIPTPELLLALQEIELRHGRVPHERWGPRTLDIDILLSDGEIIELPHLVIPHPLMHRRRFVLLPLDEIASTWIHPVLKQRTSELLHALDDPASVAWVGRLP
jgi:2-amino-4-hydroxy-6-hydroxymethyldihydropteridine diphosphokinase